MRKQTIFFLPISIVGFKLLFIIVLHIKRSKKTALLEEDYVGIVGRYLTFVSGWKTFYILVVSIFNGNLSPK